MSVDGFLEDGDRPRTRPRKRLRDRWLLLGVIGVLLLALLTAVGIAGFYGKAAFDAMDSVRREPSLAPTPGASRPVPVPTAEGETHPPVNFVLMGSDTRGGERGRSDVLQLLHIPGDRSEAFLMSIPRDTWVEIPGRGEAKINAAYSFGGAGLTVETLEQLLDVPMDHTVIIDFVGFINVIDALGGVTVNNRHASNSRGFDFPAGDIELTGESALVFVRERYSLPEGDFDRAERQRDVVKAVVSKIASTGTLTDPARFRDVVTTLGPNFTVDESLTNQRMIDIAMQFGVSKPDIKSFQFPVSGTGTSSDGQSIVIVDEAGLADLREALRTDDMATYVAEH